MIVVSAMSQFMAITASTNLKCRTAIISITGKYADNVEFELNDNLVDVLHLHFEDYREPHEDSMTHEDAEKIAEFLKKNIDKIDWLIVHCGFGTSRSVGTAIAIVNSFCKNESELIHIQEEGGNEYCYGLVTSALDVHFSGESKKSFEMKWSKK